MSLECGVDAAGCSAQLMNLEDGVGSHGILWVLHHVVAVAHSQQDVALLYVGFRVGGARARQGRIVEVALLSQVDDLGVFVVLQVCDDHLSRVAVIGPVVGHAELDGLRSDTFLYVGIAEVPASAVELEVHLPCALALDFDGNGVAILLQVHQVVSGSESLGLVVGFNHVVAACSESHAKCS